MIMSFTNPHKKISKGVKSEEQGHQRMEPPPPTNDQEIPCPERHEHNGRSDVVDRNRATQSLVPSSFSRLNSSGFLFLGVCKRHCLSWNGMKYELAAWQNHQSSRVHYQWKVCPTLGKKQNTVFMHIMPLMMPILRSTDYISNFMRSSVWKCIDFFKRFMVDDTFYFTVTAGHPAY